MSIDRQPNKFAGKAKLIRTAEGFQVKGYQSYRVENHKVIPGKSHKQWWLLRPFFKSDMGSVLDLGANGGLYSVAAKYAGVSTVCAVEMDPVYCDMLREISGLVGGIDVHRSKVESWMQSGDTTLALALVHWLYSCTAKFGSLDEVVGHLRKLTRKQLFVEWVDPKDSRISRHGHIKFNKNCITAPYDRKHFLRAMAKHFDRCDLLGDTRKTRQLYIARC